MSSKYKVFKCNKCGDTFIVKVGKYKRVYHYDISDNYCSSDVTLVG
jgi:predicted RNA-binding Zn-ribbon protein involved in translation (DUF1610 family)